MTPAIGWVPERVQAVGRAIPVQRPRVPAAWMSARRDARRLQSPAAGRAARGQVRCPANAPASAMLSRRHLCRGNRRHSGRPRPVGGRRWRGIGTAAKSPGARFESWFGGESHGSASAPRGRRRARVTSRASRPRQSGGNARRSLTESISGHFGGPLASVNGGVDRRSQRGGGRPACPLPSIGRCSAGASSTAPLADQNPIGVRHGRHVLGQRRLRQRLRRPRE